METMFESTNKLMRDEMGYWNTQMLKAAQTSITEGEKFASAIRENMTRALNTQTDFMFGIVKHNAELVERQMKAATDAFQAVNPMKAGK